MVLERLTVRGSVVGTRLDLRESLAFAAEGKVRVAMTRRPLAAVNDTPDALRRGTATGPVVLDVAGEAGRKDAGRLPHAARLMQVD